MTKEQKKKGTMEDFIKIAGNSSLKIDKSMSNVSFVSSSSQSRETGQMFDSASAQEYNKKFFFFLIEKAVQRDFSSLFTYMKKPGCWF